MVVQASGARRLAERDPARASDAFLAVETSGREALTEIRRLLGVLRHDDEELALAPQPSLRHVGSLLRKVEAAGLPVELAVEGDERELPIGIDLTAYRVVQEALGGALEHGHAGRAQVRAQLRGRARRPRGRRRRRRRLPGRCSASASASSLSGGAAARRRAPRRRPRRARAAPHRRRRMRRWIARAAAARPPRGRPADRRRLRGRRRDRARWCSGRATPSLLAAHAVIGVAYAPLAWRRSRPLAAGCAMLRAVDLRQRRAHRPRAAPDAARRGAVIAYAMGAYTAGRAARLAPFVVLVGMLARDRRRSSDPCSPTTSSRPRSR